MFSMYQVFLLTLALGDLGHCRLDSSPVLVREVPNHARSQNVAIVSRNRLGNAEHHKTIVFWRWHGARLRLESSL